MTPEAWVFLGVCVTALCGIVVAFLEQRKSNTKIATVAQDVKATRNQVSNGHTTLMRDDLVQTRDIVLCIKGQLTGLARSVEVIQERQIHASQEVAEIRERVSGLTDDIQNCPLRHPDKGN